MAELPLRIIYFPVLGISQPRVCWFFTILADCTVAFVNTSGKAGAQIPQPPLGDDSPPWGR
jgi:hypothetical protein